MPAPNVIKDCMRRNPLTIGRDANLVKAIEMIVEYKLTGLTVTDDDGSAVGILSELDCIRGVLNTLYNDGDPEQALVKDVMSTDLSTCAPGDSIVSVAQLCVSSLSVFSLPHI